MTIDTGGAAFPSQELGQSVACAGLAPGMSLLDWFAGMALQALVAKAPLVDAEGEHGAKFDLETLTQFRHDMAVSAYDYAAMMIAEKRRTEATP